MLWQQIKDIASNLGMEPSKKRTVMRQRNRTNPVVEDIESHYRLAYFYAFLDHTINHMKTRFPKELEGALIASYLLPCNIGQFDSQKITTIKNEFESVCPQPSNLEREVQTWTVHISELEDNEQK